MSQVLAELRHPIRRELLRLTIATDQPVSPSDLAKQVEGPTLSTVSYHVRILSLCGALELVATQQSRGATRHFYRAAMEAEQAHEALRLAEGPDADPAGDEIS
jgi:DNA-binding transcriptional ArsR family regulator